MFEAKNWVFQLSDKAKNQELWKVKITSWKYFCMTFSLILNLDFNGRYLWSLNFFKGACNCFNWYKSLVISGCNNVMEYLYSSSTDEMMMSRGFLIRMIFFSKYSSLFSCGILLLSLLKFNLNYFREIRNRKVLIHTDHHWYWVVELGLLVTVQGATIHHLIYFCMARLHLIGIWLPQRLSRDNGHNVPFLAKKHLSLLLAPP